MKTHQRLSRIEQALEEANIARITDAAHRITLLAGVPPELVIAEAVGMYRVGEDTSDAGLAAEIRILAQQMGRSEAELHDEYHWLLRSAA